MSRRSEKEEAAHLQYETEHTDPGKSPSVLPYLAILVAAAFVLLIMAYFMQRRTAESVQGLHESVTTIQSIDQIVEDNRALEQELAQLKAEQAQLQAELDETKAQLQATQNTLANAEGESAKQAAALNTLNQLRALYNQRRYHDARTLLAEATTLEEELTAVSQGLSEEERSVYDPLESYQRLARLLG